MAKMFYKLGEAAARLGKSEEEVRAMAERGELTEFRSGEDLVFKVDQVDLLAPDDDGSSVGELSSQLDLTDTSGGSGSMLGLSDTGAGTALGLSSSGAAEAPQEDEREQTGISVFDADELEDVGDAAAQTQIEDIQGGIALDDETLESFGSGSGLMELTQESDDTALGAQGLLDELGPADETAFGNVDLGAGSSAAIGGPAGELFEGGAAEEESAPAAVATVAAEPYDGPGSGLLGGSALASVIGLLFGLAVAIMGMVGFVPEGVVGFAGAMTPMIVAGGLVVLVGLFGVVGMVLGGKS